VSINRDVEIIGFDLGHGETAVALAMLSATVEPQILDVYGTKSILTAVAQHPTRGVLIGDDAFMARNVNTLRIAFKSPDIDRQDVREPLTLFVGKVLEVLLRDRKITGGDATLFFVGCPSGWSETVRLRYAELLRQAGMTHVTVWPESRAALVYARESGYISQDLAEGTILIVDIGSSTTDFTAVQHLEIRISDFGQNALGGGLLDKAILQRTVATHPRQAELRQIFADYPVYAAICELECRKVKEMYFSNPEMWQDTPASRSVRLETTPPLYVDIAITPQVMDELLAMPLPQLRGHSWYAAFREALQQAHTRLQEVPPQLVLLTGGASRMAFTADLCAEIFPQARIVRGAEPEFAIARGLASAGRVELKTIAFREEVERLLTSGKLRETAEEQLPSLIRAVAAFLAQRLADHTVLPAFRDWQTGRIRTLAELEQTIQPRAVEWLGSAEGRQSLAQVVAVWFIGLLPAVEKLTDPICDAYRIPHASLSVPPFLNMTHVAEVPEGMVDMGSMTFLGDVGNVVTLLGSIIIAKILGGGGTALLMPGPLGLLIGLVIGLVTLSLGKGIMIDWFKGVELPTLARGLISESRVKTALTEQQGEFEEKIHEALANNLPAFNDLLGALAQSITDALHKAADKAVLLIR
jgi:molecular chaperone DnaK (HSP70)